ncbi:Uncharacterised protein [Mycobacterium tuberculosis]|nr:Uncharacterised protein [Mycobacterium tuberculosis]
MPPGSHASTGDHRYWLLIHDPFGRPRTMRPSQPSVTRTQVVTLVGRE